MLLECDIELLCSGAPAAALLPPPPSSLPPPTGAPAPAGRRLGRSLRQAVPAPPPLLNYGTFPDSLLQNLTDALRTDLAVSAPSFLVVSTPVQYNISRVAPSGAYFIEPGWKVDFFVTGFGRNETAAAAAFAAVGAVQQAPLSTQSTRVLTRFNAGASVAAVLDPVTNIDFRSAWLSVSPQGAAARDAAQSPGFGQAVLSALSRNGFVLLGDLTVLSPYPAPYVAPPVQVIVYDKDDRVGLIVGLVTGMTALLVVLFLAGYFTNNWLYKRREARGDVGRRRKQAPEPVSPYLAVGQAAHAAALEAKQEFLRRCAETGVDPSDKEAQDVYWARYEEVLKSKDALNSPDNFQSPGQQSPDV